MGFQLKAVQSTCKVVELREAFEKFDVETVQKVLGGFGSISRTSVVLWGGYDPEDDERR